MFDAGWRPDPPVARRQCAVGAVWPEGSWSQAEVGTLGRWSLFDLWTLFFGLWTGRCPARGCGFSRADRSLCQSTLLFPPWGRAASDPESCRLQGAVRYAELCGGVAGWSLLAFLTGSCVTEPAML